MVTRLDETALATAIDCFYAASFEQQQLPSALQTLAVATDAEGCIVTQSDKSGFGCLGSPEIAEAVDTFANGGWVDRNYRFERGQPFMGQSRLVTESMLLSPAALDREPMQAEFLDRLGLRWWAGLRIAEDGDASMLLSIERARRNDPFDGADYAALLRAAPHFRSAGANALAVGRAFERGMLEGLENVKRPAILLDGIARPIAMNDSASAIFDDLFCLMERRLRSRSCRSDAALQNALASLLNADTCHLGTPSPPFRLMKRGGGSVWARVAPVAGPLAYTVKRPKILVTLQNDRSEHHAKAAVLRDAFALTPSEVRIALALADGVDLSRIADLQQISLATVRTHLKAIFLKTETNRQLELALLVNRID